ncbi:MAG: peptidylprolyl isomerase, partial [Cyclobacteriaceae bacterium]|nr:peptidylprolyl isomerase [Cyclobacteriaceae bacterium]
MKVFNKIAGGLVLSLNVLLIFFLIFQERLSLPAWLQSVGRMHPLLLHLPIGIVIVVLLLSLFRSEVKPKSFDKVMGWLLTLSALTTVTAALMGLVLSREGGYDDTQLNYHLISGSAFSFMAWLLMLIGPEQKGSFQLLAVANVILVILAGHFGSVLTHGENFVWAPLMKTPGPALLTDSTSLYQAAIEPVLRSKCFSCHNEQKKKGKLLMTSVAAIARGGKHGPIWVSGDPERSSLIQRINLPEDHEEHMPPSGKTPLTEKEKQLLFQWIARGANTSQAWTRYAKSDSLFLLAKEFIHTTPNTNTQPVYNFTAASEETIKKLNTPYRTVTPLAAESPALAAEFFLSQAFDYKQLSELTTIKEQLVDLSLAGMPVTDA